MVDEMDCRLETSAAVEPPFDILAPREQSLALVLASPHSGAEYPADLLAASRLDPLTLRRSEDSFVDEIFGEATLLGAPLLRARFPRAYLDANREPWELDPGMFEDALPEYVNQASPRVRAGLGTIARVVASGEDIYARKLRFADAVARIERLYKPYHRALGQLLDVTRRRFGYYLLLDCHSMPSAAERGRGRVDVVLGDCHGTSCAPEIVESAHAFLTARGYAVLRNSPYAGGFTTCHYGRPAEGAHALQIELNRGLYMDERAMERRPGFRRLVADMTALVGSLAALDERALAA
jgi:N-formylglutamate amidohydrolase